MSRLSDRPGERNPVSSQLAGNFFAAFVFSPPGWGGCCCRHSVYALECSQNGLGKPCGSDVHPTEVKQNQIAQVGPAYAPEKALEAFSAWGREMTRLTRSGVSNALRLTDANRTAARAIFVKHASLLLAVALASFAAACSSGGSSFPTPPPPTGKFSNASLKGTYAFSMSGTDASANIGAFIARVGSFVADGSGGISI